MLVNTRKLRLLLCENKLKIYRELISLNNENTKLLDKIYKYIKIKESKLNIQSGTEEEDMIREYIYGIETIFSDMYLIPYKPKFSLEMTRDDISDSPSSILDYIVNESRKTLYIQSRYLGNNSNIDEISTINKCHEMAVDVIYNCQLLNIKNKLYKLNPGYIDNSSLFGGSGYHYITIAELFGKYYLIDPSYSQYFTVKRNSLERLGICNVQNCLVGRYMMMTKERIAIAKKLMSDGWLELNESNFKAYLDGFTLFYRNGLYYEKTHDFSYEPPYTINDYLKFLRGEDNQVNHEGEECLGYQKRPLHDPYLDFKRSI